MPAKSQADASEKGMSATFLAASTKSVIDNQVGITRIDLLDVIDVGFFRFGFQLN